MNGPSDEGNRRGLSRWRKPLATVQTAARFALASTTDQRQLLGVGWSITEKCNSQCPFCDRHSGPTGPDLATAERIIDELAELGCGRVHLTGGEPLMKKEIVQILHRLGKHGILRTINTNGALLADRPEVIDHTDAFVVSVDGPPALHDRFRGEKSFERMSRGLELLAQKKKRFAFSVALFRSNIDELDFFFELARKHRALLVMQPGTTHIIGSEEPNPEMPDPGVFRATIQKILDDPEKRRWVWNSRPALETMLKWPEPHDLRCHAGRITCRLEVDGSLYPCSRTIHDPRCQPAPNAFELGIKEAFARLVTVDCSQGRCWAAHNVEKSLIFSWHPEAIANLLLRNYTSRHQHDAS